MAEPRRASGESFDTTDTTDVPFFISREKVGGTREKEGMAEGQA